jgi:hypothetical protein
MAKSFLIVSFLLLFNSFLSVAQVRYELPAGRYITEVSHRIALTQAGVSDAKNPSVVREYLKAAGVGYYNPFCQSGQYWSFVQAKQALSWINLMFGTTYSTTIPVPKSALANSSYNYAIKKGIRTGYIAKKYDLLIWRAANGINGHIERVDSVCAGGWVKCIGFNTGNREVKLTRRNIYNLLGRLQVRGLVGFRYESN